MLLTELVLGALPSQAGDHPPEGQGDSDEGVDDLEMSGTTTTLAAENVLRLNLGWLDYVLVAIYFVFVLGIGFIARSQISTSLDFFLSGRRLPA